MKKSFFTTLILMVFILGGLAQSTYYPLLQEGNNRQQWNVVYITTGSNYPNDYLTEIQSINNNITLDGTDYKLVWSKMRYDSPQIAGAVREEDKRVYFRKYVSAGYYEEEALLYDFNLTVGDMVTVNWYGETLMVIEESEVEINGTMRRQLGLGDPNSGVSPFSEVYEYWIEGVGSTYGFLNSGYESWMGAFVYLLCYHEDDNLLWQNEDFESCVMNSGVFTFFDEASGLNFNITSENTVEVTRKLDIVGELNTYEGDIVIPETVTYGGVVYTVTKIGEMAFAASQMLNSVIVPQTVTSVGEKAFYYCPLMQSVTLSDNITDMGTEVFRYCEQLTMVNIPQTTTYLPDYLFNGCASLTSIDIPNLVTHIGNYAFSGTALTSVVIPNTVNTIGDGAFQQCRNLESVHLPESLECINGFLFSSCENLSNVNIPNSVEAIGGGAFQNCKLEGDLVFPEGLVEVGISAFEHNKLTAVSFKNPKTSIKRMAFAGCNELTSVSLPNQLDTIARYAFQLTGLQSITIPSSVVDINEGAFWGCDSLSQVYIPQNVSNINAGAFGYCHSLKNIEVDNDNVYYKSVDGVLFNASKSKLVQYPVGKENENYQVPGSVTNVFAMSFEGAENLQHINLPNTLANIGERAFRRCYGLHTITIPSGNIGRSAFYDCNGLTSVVIGPEVTYIGSDAFQFCSNLSLVILGNPQATILSGAFNTYSQTVKLTMVCLGDTPGYGINEQIFPNQTLQEMMILPCGTQQVYEDWWGSYWSSLNFEEDCNEHQINLIGNSGGNQVILSTATAMLGEEVHYTVALESGYMLNSIEVYKADDETIEIPVKNNGFIMPNFDVVVKAHFLPLSLEEPGAEWYYEIQNENGSITYQYLQHTNDTTINDDPVQIIVKINTLYDKGEHIEISHEYIYEKNNIVYWWNKTLGEFTVLYDFGAEEGDEWEIKVGTSSLVMHVDAVEHYDFEGCMFKMLQVSDTGNLFSGTVICGIGHLTSFFPEKLINQSKKYRVEGIRCFWHDDELIFKYGEKDCDEVYEEYHYEVEEPVVQEDFRVYPNPTKNSLFIITNNVNSSNPTYTITNLLGQTLLTGRITAENQQINISFLPDGLFFIRLGKTTLKLIKE